MEWVGLIVWTAVAVWMGWITRKADKAQETVITEEMQLTALQAQLGERVVEAAKEVVDEANLIGPDRIGAGGWTVKRSWKTRCRGQEVTIEVRTSTGAVVEHN